jgi:hypothetical protein
MMPSDERFFDDDENQSSPIRSSDKMLRSSVDSKEGDEKVFIGSSQRDIQSAIGIDMQAGSKYEISPRTDQKIRLSVER